MDIPAGTLTKGGLPSESTDFLGLLNQMAGQKFSGYLAITICESEIEQGVEFFDAGKPVASVYAYPSLKLEYYGADAWPRILNASAATNGVIDVVELSGEQVRLVLAFNEKMVCTPASADLSARKIKFSTEFIAQAIEKVPASREELLKKYGISPAARMPEAKEGMQPLPTIADYAEKLLAQKDGKKA